MAYLFILATFTCFVDLIASIIIKFISQWTFSESNEDQVVRKDLIALKKEMASISMVDEFSRYAKLQRKYNKLEVEAKEKINTRLSSRMKLRMSLTYGIRVLNGIFTSILLFLYRTEPVLMLPNDSLWPLGSFFSWPTGIENSISLPTWLLLMRLTVSSHFRLSAS